jgi:hypothetical protein
MWDSVQLRILPDVGDWGNPEPRQVSMIPTHPTHPDMYYLAWQAHRRGSGINDNNPYFVDWDGDVMR